MNAAPDDKETIWLIRYDPNAEDRRLWPEESLPWYVWRDMEDHSPWLMGTKTRHQWARAWKRQQRSPSPPEPRDAASFLELCAFRSEAAARTYAADCFPGALKSMTFITVTMSEATALADFTKRAKRSGS